MDAYKRQLLIAVSIVMFYLVAGTVFFHAMENWSYVDSFYFSGVTLTTVGYGDLTPTHDFTKIATVFFAFSGISIVFYSVSVIARRYFEREEERMQKIWEAAKDAKEKAASQNIVTKPLTHSIAKVKTATKKIHEKAQKHYAGNAGKSADCSKNTMIKSANAHQETAAQLMKKD
jgi:hypothetical protein